MDEIREKLWSLAEKGIESQTLYEFFISNNIDEDLLEEIAHQSAIEIGEIIEEILQFIEQKYKTEKAVM